MTLRQSNPYLRSPAARRLGLHASAKSSSAIEGIRAPFAKGKAAAAPRTTAEFIAYWKQRAAANGR